MAGFLKKILDICVSSALLGTTILTSVLVSSPHHIAAQTLESIQEERSAFKNNPQIKLGGSLEQIAINSELNKIYVTDLESNTVAVINSNSGNITNIPVGVHPTAIAINPFSHKVYVANKLSDTVSVINGFSDKKELNDVPVGYGPSAIVINPFSNKVYVLTPNSDSVSIINGTSDKVEANVPVGSSPTAIDIGPLPITDVLNKVYVTNSDSNTVSVINGTDQVEANVPVEATPTAVAASQLLPLNKVYVTNSDSNTVSVINATNDKVEATVHVGQAPAAIAFNSKNISSNTKVYVVNKVDDTVSVIQSDMNGTDIKEPNDIAIGPHPASVGILPPPPTNIVAGINKVYVANSGSNTISVIDVTNDKKELNDIRVGIAPTTMVFNRITGILYVLNSNTVSAIKASDDKVAAGITFNVSPGNSGNIVCNNANYPTNTYLYVEAGTECYAKANRDFEFSSWVQNLGHNSTITLNTTAFSDSPWDSLRRLFGATDKSTTFDINAFGTFTANFKPLPPPVPPEYWASLFTVVATAIIGSLLIPAVFGWFKSKRQSSRLNSYHREINLFGKGNTERLNKSYIMITNGYSEGKINNEQYTNLKTEISILYEEIYKKRIDSSVGNVVTLDKIKDDIEDAYAKGKLIEQHYKLLIERISNSPHDQQSAA
jgi:YVTN family beta-propeller protein